MKIELRATQTETAFIECPDDKSFALFCLCELACRGLSDDVFEALQAVQATYEIASKEPNPMESVPNIIYSTRCLVLFDALAAHHNVSLKQVGHKYWGNGKAYGLLREYLYLSLIHI